MRHGDEEPLSRPARRPETSLQSLCLFKFFTWCRGIDEGGYGAAESRALDEILVLAVDAVVDEVKGRLGLGDAFAQCGLVLPQDLLAGFAIRGLIQLPDVFQTEPGPFGVHHHCDPVQVVGIVAAAVPGALR